MQTYLVGGLTSLFLSSPFSCFSYAYIHRGKGISQSLLLFPLVTGELQERVQLWRHHDYLGGISIAIVTQVVKSGHVVCTICRAGFIEWTTCSNMSATACVLVYHWWLPFSPSTLSYTFPPSISFPLPPIPFSTLVSPLPLLLPPLLPSLFFLSSGNLDTIPISRLCSVYCSCNH